MAGLLAKSRFCSMFRTATAEHHHRRLSPHQVSRNLIFSLEFWEPFIGVKSFENERLHRICGPLLGFLFELSNLLDANLTYIPDNNTSMLPFTAIEKRGVQLVLTPFPPMSLNDSNVKRLIRISRTLGDLPMISILSGKREISFDLQALTFFNDLFIYYFASFFLMINVFALFLTRLHSGRYQLDLVASLSRAIIRQPIADLNRKPILRLFASFVLFMSFFLYFYITNSLLTFFAFGNPFDKLDNVAELARHSEMQVFLFDGETSVTLLTDPSGQYFHQFKERIIIQDPRNEDVDKWEQEMAVKIGQRKLAIVTDKYYLDYFFNSHKSDHPNLYRSVANEVVLPYFLPLSFHNPKWLNCAINKLIERLIESGIYQFWVHETLSLSLTRRDPSHRIDYSNFTIKELKIISYIFLHLLNSATLILVAEMVYYRITTKLNFLHSNFESQRFISK